MAQSLYGRSRQCSVELVWAPQKKCPILSISIRSGTFGLFVKARIGGRGLIQKVRLLVKG